MNLDDKPLLAPEEIEKRKTMFIVELEIEQLFLQRDKHNDANENALASPDIFALAISSEEYYKIETEFEVLADRLKNLVFDRFELEVELLFISGRCRLERVKTQKYRMLFSNRMERKLARHENRKPSPLFDNDMLEVLKEEMKHIQDSMEDL